jgi:hypothetical protein
MLIYYLICMLLMFMLINRPVSDYLTTPTGVILLLLSPLVLAILLSIGLFVCIKKVFKKT